MKETENDESFDPNACRNTVKLIESLPGGKRLVEGYVPTVYELEVLANHYYDIGYEIELFFTAHPFFDFRLWRIKDYAIEKQWDIETALGTDKFEKATKALVEEWDRKWDELEERRSNLVPCTECGGNRCFDDELSPKPNLCHYCRQLSLDSKIEGGVS